MSHSPVRNPFSTVSDTRLESARCTCRKYLSIPTVNKGGRETCQNQNPTADTASCANPKGIPAQ
jgi:hypothetical protein